MQDEIDLMVGDVNLFLSSDEENGNLKGNLYLSVYSLMNKLNNFSGEISIMVAEKSSRGIGIGWEAACLMMRFGMDTLNIKEFEAKIKQDNHGSISMFEKLTFQEVSRSEAFQEITFFASINDSGWRDFIVSQTKFICESFYENQK